MEHTHLSRLQLGYVNKAAFPRISPIKPTRQLTAISWQPTRATMGTGATAAVAVSKQPIEMPEALPLDFDKSQFNRDINIKALKITKKQCHRHLLNKPRLRNVMDIPGDDESRLLLLQEGLTIEEFYERQISGEPSSPPLTLHDIITRDSLEITDATVQLTYDDVSLGDVLHRLLPENIEVPSSFEQVGHIAHLNLRDELLPYRKIIGAVLLEKNPRVKTVINKVGTIENEWRVFTMDLLAGEDLTVTEVKQHGARFCLDFRKVYWNSRLEAEHKRLVEQKFNKGEVIVDAMAGVGPFAVPAGQKGCLVLANDLNPDSYHWLVENININKVGYTVCPFNLDGREFMRNAAGGKLQVEFTSVASPQQSKKKKRERKKQEEEQKTGEENDTVHAAVVTEEPKAAVPDAPRFPVPIPPFHHIVMNLPATAVEFLDALNGSFDPGMWKGKDLPTVHVYAFLKKDETVQDLQRRMEAALGGPLESSSIEFYSVRDVAPNKQMFCASFRLPKDIAFASVGDKRQRTE
ncbi:hypothetical protein KSW81_006949 [Nannochloris sp. 'desiccata']|nr:hypothetical protein KSW81_006949 [Chlorella desiccata (nom. nud.)]